jgi:drug/metabolite transporter (DMT)-like permease
MGLGEFFALSSAFVWALAIVLFRRCGPTLPAFETNLYKIFIGFILLLPTIGLTEGWAMPRYTAAELGIVILSGYIGIAVADTLYLRALQLVGASRTGIVSSLLSPFIIILSVLFLSESLGLLQLLGFVLVMAGLLLVSWQTNREEVDIRDLRKGMAFGVAAVFLMAVGVVMVKPILETHSFVWTVQLRMSAGLAGMLIFLAFRGRYRRVLESFRKPLPWGQLTVASFLGSYLSMMMWLYSYKLIPASVSAILNQSTNAWMVLLAWLVLHEYIGMRKIYGLILTTGGVLMMLLA